MVGLQNSPLKASKDLAGTALNACAHGNLGQSFSMDLLAKRLQTLTLTTRASAVTGPLDLPT